MFRADAITREIGYTFHSVEQQLYDEALDTITLAAAGFYGFRSEWWHFTSQDWQQLMPPEEAKRAVAELHDKEFLGRKLVVSGAKTSEHRSEH